MTGSRYVTLCHVMSSLGQSVSLQVLAKKHQEMMNLGSLIVLIGSLMLLTEAHQRPIPITITGSEMETHVNLNLFNKIFRRFENSNKAS